MRCLNSLHGLIFGGAVEVKCRSRRCGARSGVVVLHRFDLDTGELIDTRMFKDPIEGR
jgi:hypothetical protein